MSARSPTWSALLALPKEQQVAYWRTVMARWTDNAERERDGDVEFDHQDERNWWDDGGRQ
jgi:hypothetical protein